MGWQIEQLLSADLSAPAAARAMATRQLAGRLGAHASELTADVVLVLSELVTNAVVAGSTTVRVALDLRDGTLSIEVTDDGAGWPDMRPAGAASVGGRGLLIVTRLARQWGARPVARGKAVWASFSVPAAPRGQPATAPSVPAS